MQAGGCLLTVSHYGAEKVVDHYNIMGPVKAALEGTARYLAAELDHKAFASTFSHLARSRLEPRRDRPIRRAN